MASGTRSDDLACEIWGTWEELLLASAVNRHGTRSWDSVAMEIQARSPFSDLLTPQTCRRRFIDLKRRFESGGEGVEELDAAGGGGESGSPADVPWLEELRKIRMAELRREVDRYDVSITSLQLKLKNLRAERERNDAGDRGEPDPKDNETIKDGESPGPVPDPFVGDLNSVGNSSGSCKESNSTDPKEKDANPDGGVGTEPEKTPDNGALDDAAHPPREDSYNGSSETLSKGSETADGAGLLLGESGESVAGGKDNSDVQSSASLSKRRRAKRQKAVSGSSSVAEAETDAVSAVAVNVKRPGAAESQPLAAFLEIIQSNKYGSIFMRRLEAQENSRFRGTIRRYVDLEMVRSRLERKGAKYSSAEFFRDLLLLCNNAIVFFHKGSTESTAAVNLRQMVSKEMAAFLPKTVRASAEAAAGEQPSPPLPKIVPKIKLDTDLKNPLPKKNRSSGSLIACRKRSSFSKVPATFEAEAAGKEEEGELDSESDHKEQEQEQDEDKQSTIVKPKTKERSKVSGARGLRTNKIRIGSGLKQSKPAPALKPVVIAEETSELLPPKLEKKDLSPASNLTPKKKNAASFLNRLKGNSSSSSVTGTLLSSLKSSGGASIGKGTEMKRGGKGEGRKEAGTATPSPELIPPAKRSVGRPPKRMAPALTPSPPPPPPKRMKVDAAPAKRPPAQPQKKRGRK